MSDQSEDEYVRLIQAHERIIHKVVSLYVDHPEDRKDLFQEVLLQAWKSFRNFKGQSQFSTWLYKVSLNCVLTFRKKETRKQAAEKEQWTSEVSTTNEPKETHELLYELIKKLPEVDRMLISLHLDGYKNKEIAEISGMTANHVNVKIHRLKQQLIDNFKKESYGSL
jgi:RNA polymerase sigma-70 factor (ECF subfamily)